MEEAGERRGACRRAFGGGGGGGRTAGGLEPVSAINAEPDERLRIDVMPLPWPDLDEEGRGDGRRKFVVRASMSDPDAEGGAELDLSTLFSEVVGKVVGVEAVTLSLMRAVEGLNGGGCDDGEGGDMVVCVVGGKVSTFILDLE